MQRADNVKLGLARWKWLKTPMSYFRDDEKYSLSSVDWAGCFAAAAIGSIISMLATGYVFGIENHIDYLPIYNALYDQPQFVHDPFIQSLRFFSSGLWISLSGAAKYLDAYWLFLGLHFVSRWIAFLGLLACANLLGIARRRQIVLLTALLTATPLLRGYSLAGDGDLFTNYFSHSEIDDGLTLLILFLLIRGWIATAFAGNGLVFFINAFFGAWNGAMLVAVTTAMTLRDRGKWREISRRVVVGSGLALLFAAPVIRNVLTNPDFGKPLDFDYVAFLEEFWPIHFIFKDIGAVEKIGLGLMTLMGIFAFVSLGERGRLFVVATLSYVAVYVFGIIVPHITHSALILNFHLLRVSTMLQLLITLGALALATRWWFSEDPLKRHVLSPLLILFLCTPIKMKTMQLPLNLTAAILVIGISYYPNIRSLVPTWILDGKLRLKQLTLAVAAAGLIVVCIRNADRDAYARAWLAEWQVMADWARSTTSINDEFLLPITNFQGSPNPAPGTAKNDAISYSAAFEAIARRKVWIDLRNGAAVLWSPSYHGEWRERVAAVNALPSFDAKMAYAKANGIRYIIDICDNDAEHPVFSTKRLCAYEVH
jgi:hypothetical protein